MYTDTMDRNPLLADVRDPDAARVLGGPTVELARATRPDFLGNPRSPVEWSAGDWSGMEAARDDLLDLAAVREQFDRGAFLRDGYAVFEGVVRPRARERWLAALERGQQLNDALLRADWSAIDWHGLGRRPPAERVPAADLERAAGGSQQVPQGTDAAGVLTLRLHSVFAEYFPAGHLPFLAGVLTHPEMLALQRLCLGSETVYFDHNQLLSRPPGYAGGAWHSHRLGAGCDRGTVLPEEYDRQPNLLLTLCYLNGFGADDDGGLKIIRGSHLFRDPEGCRAATDGEMARGWLDGRVHPVTGRPLEMEHLALPAGSVVCCLSHAAHGVSPKAAGRQTRLCSLFCYRKPWTDGRAQPPWEVPPVWALKARRGELPPVLTELLRPGFDRGLTAGKTRSDE